MIRSLVHRIKGKLGKPLSWKEQVVALLARNAFDEAFAICEERVRAHPSDWPVIGEFGQSLFEGSLWVECARLLGLATEVGNSPDLLVRRGEALEKVYYSFIQEPWAIAELDKAFECWRQVLCLDPSRLDLYLRLGSMLMVTGKIKEAKRHFADYLRMRNVQSRARQLDPLPFKTISCIPNGIGHITLLDYYVKMRELNMIPKQEVFVLLPPGSKVNRAYLDYWPKWGLRIIEHPETVEMFKLFTDFTDEHFNVFTEIDGDVSLAYHAIAEVERRWNGAGRGPLLELSDNHRQRGWQNLAGIGMKRDNWFVTLHVRESGYTGEGDVPPNNHRNSKIETYLKAVKRITEAGGWVIRLGDPSMQPLPEMERVLDYAHSPLKSDWMDIFLCAENRFYLGTSSGPCMIPPCFGKKCALANYELLSGRPFYFGNIYLPKLLFSRNKGRLLTFREALEATTAYCFHGNFYTMMGLEFVDNAAEEIDSMVSEMMDSLKEGFSYDVLDNILNKEFNDLGANLNATYGSNSRISRDFLKKYKNLL